MTEIAELAISVDTSKLDKATAGLSKLKQAAAGVSDSTGKMSVAVAKASVAVATKVTKEKEAILKALLANEKADKAAIKKARQLLKTAKAEEAATKMALADAKANKELARSMLETVAAGKRMGKTRAQTQLAAGGIANDLMPNRFNTANIAAQFQDVGVTAAMGMNPMTIALQQGTQLSAVINSMENPLKGLAAAFTSIINPVSLLSIGLVGLVAAGIQLVDWTMTAKGALNLLANGIDAVTPYVLGLAGTLGLLYSGSIVSGIWTVTKSIAILGKTALVTGVKLTAMWAAANPVKAFILGITAALTIAYQFRDEMSKILGVDIFKSAKIGVNKIIGVFVGAYNGVKAVWSQLPDAMGDIVIRAANNTMKGFRDLLNDYIWASNHFLKTSFKEVSFGKFDNPYKGKGTEVGKAFSKEMQKAMNDVDYVGNISNKVAKAGKNIAIKLREYASSLGNVENEELEKKNKRKDPYVEIVKGAERRIKSLKVEQQGLHMTALAASTLKKETELLNQAEQQGIVLNVEQRGELHDLAAGMAQLEDQIRKTKEVQDMLKDSSRGFFRDLKTGIQEGNSLWDSFKNAALNALNKILDKILDLAIASTFENSGGGFLGDILGGIFGGIAGPSSEALLSAPIGSAPGYSVSRFAKGGAFTNAIVSTPTVFAFANGDSFGVMGESGSEAVMPLERGPDGTLGVRMYGDPQASNNNQPSVVVNQNINVSTGVVATVRKEIIDMMPAIQDSARRGVNDAQARGIK